MPGHVTNKWLGSTTPTKPETNSGLHATPAVNELLFNFVGPNQLNTATEDELLDHIRYVAVKTIHPEVYRQQCFWLKQSDETITHFASRLKSQAMQIAGPKL